MGPAQLHREFFTRATQALESVRAWSGVAAGAES